MADRPVSNELPRAKSAPPNTAVSQPSSGHDTGHGTGHDTSHALAYASIFLVTCLFAGNFLAGKFALLGFAPPALAQLRVAAAALMLAGIFLAHGRHSRVPSGLKEWLFLALLASLGITINQLCFVTGLGRTSVLHAGLIGGLGPIIIFGLSVATGVEKLTLLKSTGTLISLGGIVLFVTQKSGPGAQASLVGDAIVFAGTVAFSGCTTLEKRIAGKYDHLTLNAFVFGLGALLMLPFTVRSVAAVSWSAVPLRAWRGLGFMALGGSVIAYVLYAFALSRLTASKVGAFAYVQPILVAILAVLFTNEHVTMMEVVGGAFVLLGMYLAGRPPARNFHRLAHGGA
ncbi:MAG: DMT family transporter [Gemmatimonadaceae bacterium]